MLDHNSIKIHLPEEMWFSRLIHDDLRADIDDAIAKIERETGVAVQLVPAVTRFTDEINFTFDAIRVFIGANPWQVVMPVIDAVIQWYRDTANASSRPLPQNPTVSVKIIGNNNSVQVHNYYLGKGKDPGSES